MFLVIIIFVSSISILVSGILWGCDYEPCGLNDPNTMCRFPEGVNHFNWWCMGRGTTVGYMTDEIRRKVLDTHNEFRNKVAMGNTDPLQPTAANMMKLRYNHEAERIVVRWLTTCEGAHDQCRFLKDGTPAGQNLWAGSYMSRNWSNVVETVGKGQVESYYNEIKYLAGRTKEDVENFQFSYQAGHYTAMIWADVSEIGCGWMRSSIAHDNYATGAKAGCNYVGSPNLQGGTNYKVGPACSQCPEGAHCSIKYPGLCTYESKDEEENNSIPSSYALSLYPNYSTLYIFFVVILFQNKWSHSYA